MMLSMAMPIFAQSREEGFFTIATSTLVDTYSSYVDLKVDPDISTEGICVYVLSIRIVSFFLSARPQDCEATYSTS